ncbi:hypothetical protein D3C71_1492290 [compost metagenome]
MRGKVEVQRQILSADGVQLSQNLRIGSAVQRRATGQLLLAVFEFLLGWPLGEEVAEHRLDMGQHGIGLLRSGLQFNGQPSLRLKGREVGFNVVGQASAFTQFIGQSVGENPHGHL